MNTIDLVELGRMFTDQYDKPTPLFQDDQHAVYWLGVPEGYAFRCNTYLIVDGQEAILVDPGSHQSFEFIKKRIVQILPVGKLVGLVLCHQDPDVAASMTDWLSIDPQLWIITSVRANVLLPGYGESEYRFFNINENPIWSFQSGRQLKFIESPFLHFPGAFTTYDVISGFLFSGDVWASIDMDQRLVEDDFDMHELKLNLFHVDYMANNVAARGFVGRLRNLELNAILPQHGAIIPRKHISKATEYLRELKCGLDLIYPELKQER